MSGGLPGNWLRKEYQEGWNSVLAHTDPKCPTATIVQSVEALRNACQTARERKEDAMVRYHAGCIGAFYALLSLGRISLVCPNLCEACGWPYYLVDHGDGNQRCSECGMH